MQEVLLLLNAESSFFLCRKGSLSEVWLGKAHFLNAERLVLLMQIRLTFCILNAERLNAGKALYPFL